MNQRSDTAPSPGRLINSRSFFLTAALEAGSPRSGWSGSVSGEDPLPGSQAAIFLLGTHMAEGVREFSGALYQVLIPF